MVACVCLQPPEGEGCLEVDVVDGTSFTGVGNGSYESADGE